MINAEPFFYMLNSHIWSGGITPIILDLGYYRGADKFLGRHD